MKKTVLIGKPHMLVNNAGPVAIGSSAGFLDMMTAAMKMIHFVTEDFLATKPAAGAGIVNISSVVGPIFGGGGSWYSTAKAGIAGFTKNLAVTLKADGIRVNTVSPGGRKSFPTLITLLFPKANVQSYSNASESRLYRQGGFCENPRP
jgi:NAD(P)-dependent dehydrogenase (short-subunit alcohol dehydrogenase family)